MRRRREFIAGLGGAVAWPFVARAQQGERMRRIGVLFRCDENETKTYISAFTQRLADFGWIDGRNVRMDPRFTRGDINRIRALAQELVGSQPDVILADGTTPTAALQRETRTIPIVFVVVADPVGSGFVAKVSQPAGNITGFAYLEASLGGKWLELLLEIAPGLRRAAIMFNPDTAPVSIYTPSFERAVRSLKVVPIAAPVHDDIEIETAIIGLARAGGGLVIIPDPFTVVHSVPIISAAARSNVPAVYTTSDFVRDGGLLSYAPDLNDIFRRSASYVDRILRGARPSEPPVQYPTKFELVINLKTARALGLTIPPNLLALADEVIEAGVHCRARGHGCVAAGGAGTAADEAGHRLARRAAWGTAA
jgi:putative tryptophan/tyrosine transport system substrate-binding protein